jgi:prophage regulatory protein
MRLIELLSTAKQIRTIPKSEIPNLLGEVETLKARLWLRLTEWEDLQPVVVFAKTARNQPQTIEQSAKAIQCDQIAGPQGRIVRIREVLRMVGLSRSTIWRLEREDKFPKHRNMGSRLVGWLDTEIHEWINGRFENGSHLPE